MRIRYWKAYSRSRRLSSRLHGQLQELTRLTSLYRFLSSSGTLFLLSSRTSPPYCSRCRREKASIIEPISTPRRNQRKSPAPRHDRKGASNGITIDFLFTDSAAPSKSAECQDGKSGATQLGEEAPNKTVDSQFGIDRLNSHGESADCRSPHVLPVVSWTTATTTTRNQTFVFRLVVF